jgi:hypothetical protein
MRAVAPKEKKTYQYLTIEVFGLPVLRSRQIGVTGLEISSSQKLLQKFLPNNA